MNAGDLFEALATLPGARSISAGRDGIAESRMLAGIEVARASSADERAIRRAWRDRHGGGHVPLLIIAEDPSEESSVRALGPQSAGGPVRVVGADDLLRILERLATVPPLHAVRELAEELDRLDRSGISGLQVKGLGTEHLFKTRLPLSQLSPVARDGVDIAKALQTHGDISELEWRYWRSRSTLYRWRQQAVRELAATEYGRNLGLTTAPAPPPKPVRRCEWCGEELPADATKRRRYCSSACRIPAFRARQRG